MEARWAHNPEVVGSNPAPAIFFLLDASNEGGIAQLVRAAES